MCCNCTSDDCNPCNTSDPVSDTVVFDISRLKLNANVPTAPNREAVKHSAPTAIDRETAEAAAVAAAHKRNHEEQLQRDNERWEQRRRTEAMAERRRADAGAERLRKQQANGWPMLWCANDEDARRAADEAAAEQAREDEVARLVRVEKEQAEQHLQEVQANRHMVEEFLRDNGYEHVNFKRKKHFKYKFPLHTAVKQGKPEMVRRLLRCDADPTLTNSAGKTPLQLAETMGASVPGSAELADMLSALPAP